MELSFRVNNLRNLVGMPFVPLRPITILVGRNSAGKSSFLRTLPLIKQSISTRASAPILWFGDFVDFGSFQEVVNQNDTSKRISFEFKLENVNIYSDAFRRRYISSFDEVIDDVIVQYFLHAKDQKTYREQVIVSSSMARSKLSFDFNSAGAIEFIDVNGTDIKDLGISLEAGHMSDSLFGAFELIGESTIGGKKRRVILSSREAFLRLLVPRVRASVPKTVGSSTIHNECARMLQSGAAVKTVAMDLGRATTTKAFRKFYERLAEGDFPDIKALLHIHYSYSILQRSERLLDVQYLNSFYIGPVRAKAERYYRYQELAISEISPGGENLPIFLYSLTNAQKQEFSSWVRRLYGYGVTVRHRAGHLTIFIDKDGFETNIADTGYGISQVLPVLAQLWWASTQRTSAGRFLAEEYRKVIAIEQPELHLHPAHQARLADAFAGSLESGSRTVKSSEVRLIIETHSETMINRFGELIEKNRIDHKDIAIIVFEESGGEFSSRTAFYDESGVLSNWPYDFFLYDT